MHTDDQVIQRFVDGELDPAEARSVHGHVAECAACRSRLDLARHEDAAVHELLESLDHPAPPLSAAQAIAASRTSRSMTWRRAAVIPLLVAGAAGAAYALPGSPLRTWFEGGFGGASSVEPATREADASSPSAEATGGLAVDPGSGMVVLIEDPPADGTIEASLYDGALVEAMTRGGTASFASDESRIAIRGGDPGTRFIVRIPRNAARVEIHVEQRIVFRMTGTAISASPGTGGGGTWMIPVDAPSIGTGR